MEERQKNEIYFSILERFLKIGDIKEKDLLNCL